MITKAEKNDVITVSKSYLELFSYETEYGSQTNWRSGLYPSEKTALTAFENRTLYVLKENNVFCGSMILNHVQSPEYQTINWDYPAESSKVLVLHTLCIPPSQKGNGYGQQLIKFAIQYATQTGCKAIRLDTWEGNHPAAALYKKMGFRLAGTAPMLLQGVIQEQQIFFEYEVKQMIRLNNDYNHGACKAVLQAIQQTNSCNYAGYGYDEWCEKAAASIRSKLGDTDAEIHFMIGGTQTNYTVIDAALRPYQSVICADTGHINCHEAGSIERTGHKILTAPAQNGKLSADAIRQIAQQYTNSGNADYLTEPKLVFLSSPSEYGTVYSKAELTEIRHICNEYGMYLYLDGARLAYWLTSDGCDVTLADLARLTDVFYIGGTKCGAFFGEALVLINKELRPHFRTLMKQTGGIFAKGWLLGLQFYTLFENNLYFSLAQRANQMALQLKNAFKQAGIPLFVDSNTNQQFVVLTQKQADILSKVCIYEPDHEIDADHICVRFCTSWSTTEEEISRMEQYILSLTD